MGCQQRQLSVSDVQQQHQQPRHGIWIMPIASRLLSTGTLLVNGTFDENTSISPSVFRTNATTVYAGTLDEVSLLTGAINFNGTSQYLSVNNGADTTLAIGTGDFTWEAWVYPTSFTADRLIYDGRDGFQNSLNIRLLSSTGVFRLSYNLANLAFEGTAVLANNWTHLAISRSGTSLKLFQNGIVANTSTDSTSLTNGTNRPIVGAAGYAIVGNNPFAGYISNLRLIKGLALYTGAFTPPQAILPAVSGTSLLLNVTDSANFIRDNGPNKFTLTNNGTATFIANGPFNRGSTATAQRQLPDGTLEVYNQFDEFTGAPIVDSSLQLWLDAGQTSSYAGSGTTWTDLSGNSRTGTLTNGPTYSATNGGSIVFDGTDDFVQCSGSLTVTAATFLAWIRRNGSVNQYDGILFSRGTNVSGMNFYISNQLGYHWNAAGNTYTWSSGLSVPDLTWCMVAVSVTSTAATAYLCQSSGITSGTNTVNHSSSLLDDIKIAQDEAIGNRFFNGRIATAMIYDRALSADEIATNFNALRGRYGI
jgi:hypothetical protein